MLIRGDVIAASLYPFAVRCAQFYGDATEKPWRRSAGWGTLYDIPLLTLLFSSSNGVAHPFPIVVNDNTYSGDGPR